MTEDELYAIPLNDIPTWEMIGEGNVKGCFQIESRTGRTWCQKIKPSDIDELAAVCSLIRPGSLAAKINDKNVPQKYADRKHGKEDIEALNDNIVDILDETYQLIVFQEQSMRIAGKLAGFDGKKTNSLRKAIGKKDAALMNRVKEEFMEGCKNNGHSTEDAEFIFDIIEKSNRYSFNKCFSGKETIKKAARGKHSFNPTIEEMYKIRTDIEYAKETGHLSLYKKWKRLRNYGKGWSLCSDNRVRPNIIKDIIYQGKRETLTIHLSNGKNITTTGNHKFPTSKGIVCAEDIGVGDKLYICGEYEKTDFKPLTKFSEANEDNRYHTNSYEGNGFPEGKENPSYTNGGYTSFQKFRKETSNICSICQSVDNIETDHIDGDRKNNDWDNLQKLCSSCHKKKEYLKGRTKRGEKGYPSSMVEVVSVTSNVAENVYDVVMDAPNHNLVTQNGIIACNSHAVAYAKYAYWAAYIKRHMPLRFYRSWLNRSDGKPKKFVEINELAISAKRDGIDIVSPSLTYKNIDFVESDNKIIYGLSCIKNVGLSSIIKLIEHVEKEEEILGKPISEFTWIEFLCRIGPNLNKKVAVGLIESGSLSFLLNSRNEMSHEYSCYHATNKNEKAALYGRYKEFDSLEQMLNLCKTLKKDGGLAHNITRSKTVDGIIMKYKYPGRKLNDNPLWVAHKEQDLLGVELSINTLDTCYKSQDANSTIKEVNQGKSGNISIACIITGIREHKIKKEGNNKGRLMCFLEARDESEELDSIILFPDSYEEYRELIYEESTVILDGERKDGDSLIVKKVIQI